MTEINNEYDAVRVRFRNVGGQIATVTVGAMDRTRRAFLDLGPSPRSLAEAKRAGDEFLAGGAS